MAQGKRRWGWVTAILASAVSASYQSAFAVDWDGDVGGTGTEWITGTNWAGDAVPSGSQTAVFGPGGTATSIGIDYQGATNNGTTKQIVGEVILPSDANRDITIAARPSFTGAGTLTINGIGGFAIDNQSASHKITFLNQPVTGHSQIIDTTGQINVQQPGGTVAISMAIGSVDKTGAGTLALTGFSQAIGGNNIIRIRAGTLDWNVSKSAGEVGHITRFRIDAGAIANLQGYIDTGFLETINGTVNFLGNESIRSVSGGSTGIVNINSGVTLTLGSSSFTPFAGDISGAGNLKHDTGSPSSFSVQEVRNFRINTLTMAGAGGMKLTTNGGTTGTSKASSATFATGTALDMTDNHLIFTATNRATVEGFVASGFGPNKDWQGSTGVNSSTAAASPSSRSLGVIDNADTGYSLFGGLIVNTTDILVGYTFSGDATLDEVVDQTDFNRFLNGFNGITPARWFNGDFNYSGTVTTADYLYFEAGMIAYYQSIATPIPQSLVEDAYNFATSHGLTTALPEPTGIVTALPAALLLKRRRRSLTQ